VFSAINYSEFTALRNYQFLEKIIGNVSAINDLCIKQPVLQEPRGYNNKTKNHLVLYVNLSRQEFGKNSLFLFHLVLLPSKDSS